MALLANVRSAMKAARMDLAVFRDAETLLEQTSRQVESLTRALRRYYAANAPPCDVTDGDEPLAVVIRASNVLSYNLKPASERFTVPDFDVLRQPVDYLAMFRAGAHGNWLCKVICSEGSVRIVGLKTGGAVELPKGTRLRWLGRNLGVRLRSGVWTHVMLFVPDDITS
jgi:hypothetical protein